MEAKDFRKVILFMANRFDKETAIKIWGENLGKHIFGKWVDGGTRGDGWYPDLGTMNIFYNVTESHIQELLDYIDNNYNG